MKLLRKDIEIRDHFHLMDAEGCSDYEPTESDIQEALEFEGWSAYEIDIFFDTMMKFWRWYCKIKKSINVIMEMEKQVATLAQAKRLKELGVLVNANLIYVRAGLDSDVFEIETRKDYLSGYEYDAYSVAELGAMLPFMIGCKNNLEDDFFLSIHGGRNGWHIQYVTNKKDIAVNSEGELDRPVGYLHSTYRVNYSLAQAMASYLIMLLESKALTAEEVNQRLSS